MEILSSPQAYVFNLHTTSSAEAKRMWRRKIKERWDYECAYCGSDENITIDHVTPRCKGGQDTLGNMVSSAINVIKVNHILFGKNGIFLRSF
ncbi:hypothetical protein CM15mP5_1000 [bacterium]|nr:MAG: hypothetical protein CM15mP5_1000 [bacterium]